MNVQETNKIIAEFMGLYTSVEANLISKYYLNYHRSWDWLMPVVEKCFQSTLEYGEVIYPLPYHKINDALLTINIDEVYREVADFIELINRKEDAMKK